MMGTDKTGLGILAVVAAAILWGTTGTAATFAPDVSPIAIGAAAMGIGGILQALVAHRGIVRSAPILRANRWHLVVGAVSVAIYPLAFYAFMRLAGVTIGTVISIGSAPLLAALVEYRLDGSRLTKRWVTGAAVGLAGIVLITIAESLVHANSGGTAPAFGIALGLVAGLTYAVYSWSARRLMQAGVPLLGAMGATFGAGGMLLLPIFIATGGSSLLSWNNAAVGIYMALVPMFVGYLCFGYGLFRVEASMATTITLLEPVVAAVLAVIAVGERLPIMGWVGVALVMLCLSLITMPARLYTSVLPRRGAKSHIF